MVPYSSLALEAITKAGVPALITGASYVVALERLARAAGATNWYVLHDARQLGDLAAKLSPGSALSFYFDGRLAMGTYDANVASEVLRIARIDHDAVLGKLSSDGLSLAVDFIADRSELEEFARGIPPGSRVFYGPFPARDNDGVRVVTIDFPDLDGVVRPHPH
jgi:hypothetical protein